MDKQLFSQAITKYLAGVVLVGVLIFLPAGTLNFRNGWILMAILFVPMFCAGIAMLYKSPDLLRKRLNAKEKEMEQKKVVALSGLMFLTAFILAGLNYRFRWTTLPDAVIYISAGLFLFSYVLYAEVMRENAYLSRTIEVQEDQTVVDTGLYGIVRHPMYAATLLLFLSMPLVLGSLPSFAVMLAYIPIIVKRILNEEEVLEEGLKGYKEYKEKVRYRIIPFVW